MFKTGGLRKGELLEDSMNGTSLPLKLTTSFFTHQTFRKQYNNKPRPVGYDLTV